MKSLILFIALTYSISPLYSQSISQEVIGPAGDSFANSSAMLSYTVGEPMTETFTTTNYTLTQGFEQPSLTFWIGAISTAWENPLNWNPTILPDRNADVIILSPVPRYPIITSNPSCATIKIQPGAMVIVNGDYLLSIKGH